MNKPSWKDAPAWAMWLAQDRSGEWWWYSHRPVMEHDEWFPDRGSSEPAYPESDEWIDAPGWKNTLEEREK